MSECVVITLQEKLRSFWVNTVSSSQFSALLESPWQEKPVLMCHPKAHFYAFYVAVLNECLDSMRLQLNTISPARNDLFAFYRNRNK